jgi:hypothetical protein
MGLLTGKKVTIIGSRHDLGPALHKAIKEAGATNPFSLDDMNFQISRSRSFSRQPLEIDVLIVNSGQSICRDYKVPFGNLHYARAVTQLFEWVPICSKPFLIHITTDYNQSCRPEAPGATVTLPSYPAINSATDKYLHNLRTEHAHITVFSVHPTIDPIGISGTSKLTQEPLSFFKMLTSDLS